MSTTHPEYDAIADALMVALADCEDARRDQDDAAKTAATVRIADLATSLPPPYIRRCGDEAVKRGFADPPGRAEVHTEEQCEYLREALRGLRTDERSASAGSDTR